MKEWTTSLQAIDPINGKLYTWCGPNIKADTEELAQKWCEENMGYLTVVGEFIEEIDFEVPKNKRMGNRWSILKKLLK